MYFNHWQDSTHLNVMLPFDQPITRLFSLPLGRSMNFVPRVSKIEYGSLTGRTRPSFYMELFQLNTSTVPCHLSGRFITSLLLYCSSGSKLYNIRRWNNVTRYRKRSSINVGVLRQTENNTFFFRIIWIEIKRSTQSRTCMIHSYSGCVLRKNWGQDSHTQEGGGGGNPCDSNKKCWNFQ
jgi:hypothetical protein